jgi:glutaredoxin
MRGIALLLLCAVGALGYAGWELSKGSAAPAAAASEASAEEAEGDATDGDGELVVQAKLEAEPEQPAKSARKTATEPQSLGDNTYYQYVDAENRVQFARSLEEVPEEWRGRAGRISLPVPPPSAPAQAAPARDRKPSRARRHAEGTFQTARAGGPGAGTPQPEVEIYTTQYCGACKTAKKYMRQHKIRFTEYDVQDDEYAREEYLEKTGGQPGVPVIDVEGGIMQGWNPQAFENLLAQAR